MQTESAAATDEVDVFTGEQMKTLMFQQFSHQHSVVLDRLASQHNNNDAVILLVLSVKASALQR